MCLKCASGGQIDHKYIYQGTIIKTSPEVVVIKFLHFIYSFVHRDRAASARGW